MQNRFNASDMKNALDELLLLHSATIGAARHMLPAEVQQKHEQAYLDAYALFVSEADALDGAVKEAP